VESHPKHLHLVIIKNTSSKVKLISGEFDYLCIDIQSYYFGCFCRVVQAGGSSSQGTTNNEPRGTKRHYQIPCPSRSPSPRPVNPPSTSVTTAAESSVVSKPKRRYQEIGEGLPPIVPSACHLNINIQAFRPDNLLNGGEWDKVHAAEKVYA
jgi:hypothetical protein